MEPFVGEIKLCAFPFAPTGWAFCDGALLLIAQNQALYTLLTTQYGGNGSSNFGLPDLRGRTPVHRNATSALGSKGGEETVTLSPAMTPAHSHNFVVSPAAATQKNVGIAAENLLAASALVTPGTPVSENLYGIVNAQTLAPLENTMCDPFGGSASHNNMQPSLVLNYIIALRGIYPTRD